MFRVLEIPITIAATGQSFDSDPITNLDGAGARVIGWEFTAPTYTTNPCTTTISIVSAPGRTLYTGSAIARSGVSAVTLGDTTAPSVFPGFKVHAALSDVAGAGGATLTVLVYIQTGDDKALMIPSSLVTNMNFAHITDALLVQAAPVQNTWYTVCDGITLVKLFGMAVKIADTGETIEGRLTADGCVIGGSAALNANADYRILLSTKSDGTVLTFSTSTLISANQLESRAFKLEVRKTTAAGTGTLYACASYSERG